MFLDIAGLVTNHLLGRVADSDPFMMLMRTATPVPGSAAAGAAALKFRPGAQGAPPWPCPCRRRLSSTWLNIGPT